MALTTFKGIVDVWDGETPLVLHLGDSEFPLTSDQGWTILISLIILVLSSFHACDASAHRALIDRNGSHREYQRVRQSKSISFNNNRVCCNAEYGYRCL